MLFFFFLATKLYLPRKEQLCISGNQQFDLDFVCSWQFPVQNKYVLTKMNAIQILENRLQTHSSFNRLQMKHLRVTVAIIIVATGQLAGQRHRASLENLFTCVANYLPSRNVINTEVTKKNKTEWFFFPNFINHQQIIITLCAKCDNRHICRKRAANLVWGCLENLWAGHFREEFERLAEVRQGTEGGEGKKR